MEPVIHYSVRLEPAEEDKRYRTLVMLSRSDRPSNHPYHCNLCTWKVAEMVNYEVSATTDLMDMTASGSASVGLRCDGKYYDKARGKMVNCRRWYYFMVN